MRNQKHILIPFSGGLDSTYLVYKRLTEGYKVSVVSFIIEQNETKTKIESIHQNILLDKFKLQFGENNINVIKNGYKFSNMSAPDSLVLRQPLIWLFGLQFINYEHIDVVEMSYVINDCSISYLNEIKTLFNSYKPFHSKTIKFPKLEFPISKISKDEILNILPNKYKSSVTTCEMPVIIDDNDLFLTYNYCGKCTPCMNINNVCSSRDLDRDIFGGKVRAYDKIKNILIHEVDHVKEDAKEVDKLDQLFE